MSIDTAITQLEGYSDALKNIVDGAIGDTVQTPAGQIINSIRKQLNEEIGSITASLTTPVNVNVGQVTSYATSALAALDLTSLGGSLFLDSSYDTLCAVVDDAGTNRLRYLGFETLTQSQRAGIVTTLGTVLTTPQRLVDEMAEVDLVRDFGAVVNDSGSASTNVTAFNNAFTFLKAQGGGVLTIPAGTFYVDAMVTCKGDFTIRGAGMGVSIVRVATSGHGVFECEASHAFGNVRVQDITLRGPITASTGQVQETSASRLFRTGSGATFESIVLKNVEAYGSAHMSLTGSGARFVHVDGCFIRYSLRDAINFTGSDVLVATNNRGEFIGDDFIAFHFPSSTDEALFRKKAYIAGNKFENSNGIKCLGAKEHVIVGNTSTHAINYSIFVSADSTFDEGEGSGSGLVIANNIFKNLLHTNISQASSVINSHIYLSGYVENSTLNSVPGTYSIDDESITPIAGNLEGIGPSYNHAGQGFGLIANNICAQTRVNVTIDPWRADGFQGDQTDSLYYTDDSNSVQALYLGQHLFNITIRGNLFFGCRRGVVFDNGGTIRDILLTDNHTVACRNGYVASDNDATKAKDWQNVRSVRDRFDLDPYHESSHRATNGKWTDPSTGAAYVFYLRDATMTFEEPTFRNCIGIFWAPNTARIQLRRPTYILEPRADGTTGGVQILENVNEASFLFEKVDKTAHSITSITRSGSTATVTTAADHNLWGCRKVRIAGADQSEYNGQHTITWTGSDTFTFTVSGSPATPATGTLVYSAFGEVMMADQYHDNKSGEAITGWCVAGMRIKNTAAGRNVASEFVAKTTGLSSTSNPKFEPAGVYIPSFWQIAEANSYWSTFNSGIVSAGGSLTSDEKDAIFDMLLWMVENSFLPKLLVPFMGGSAAAAVVPLINTNSLTPSVVGSLTYSATQGLTGWSTSNYIDTGWNCNTHSATALSMGVWVSQGSGDVNNTEALMVGYNGGAKIGLEARLQDNTVRWLYRDDAPVAAIENDRELRRGLYMGEGQHGTGEGCFLLPDGSDLPSTLKSKTFTNRTGFNTNLNFFVGATNDDGTPIDALSGSSKLGMFFVHDARFGTTLLNAFYDKLKDGAWANTLGR